MIKVIKIVRVFDGETLTAPTNVIIENGNISSIAHTGHHCLPQHPQGLL